MATRAVERLLDAYEIFLTEVILKPSDGGRFEVSVDDRMIYSKLDTKRFPDLDELSRLVWQAIS